MPSEAYTVVAGSLETMIGEILARGIVKKGLEKIGADPDTPTHDEMKRAIDAHICDAVKTFLGSEEGSVWAMKTKESLSKRAAANAGA